MLTTIEMKQHAIAALNARIAHDLKLAKECFDVDLEIGKNLKIEFNLKGRAAGQAKMVGRKTAGFDSRKYTMRFNVNMMIMNEKAWWHILDETVSHELAHIVDYVQRQKSGHDARWKFIHSMLEGSAATCHNLSVPVVRHVYGVAGQKIEVSTLIHNKIQKGMQYRTQKGNHPIKPFDYVGPTEITVMTSVPTRANEVAPYTVKNSVVATKARVVEIATAKAAAATAPVAAPTPVTVPVAAPGGKKTHKPSKLALAVWNDGFKTKDAFMAEFEKRGGDNAYRHFRRAVNWLA